ncbi:helix-turn-helix domain-containing protein [Mycolicibacterium porcinum]|uniref:hypothetical protein n=1 Tax=Mycolicibacterium porcinum TaxID=39693 RepID=UPI0031F884D3
MREPMQPPEAEFLERLRTAAKPSLSVRAAAKEAGISDSRWRQIIKGYRQETKDLRIPVRAPADTLARMATVVQASPEELDAVGRSDAADIMRAAADRTMSALDEQEPKPETPAETASVKALGNPAARYISEHPMLVDGVSIEELAERFKTLLDMVDNSQATHQAMTQLARQLEAATDNNPEFPTPSEIEQSLHEAQRGAVEFRTFLADVMFQVMTTANSATAAELKSLLRPLYDRAITGGASPHADDSEAPRG